MSEPCIYCDGESTLCMPDGEWICENCAHTEGVVRCGSCGAFDYADAMIYSEDGLEPPLCDPCWSALEHPLTVDRWAQSHDGDEFDDEGEE